MDKRSWELILWSLLTIDAMLIALVLIAIKYTL